ncbi:MAG: hypothetical protein ACYTFW_04515 [Planctomycetota bacterium]|jgi:hypothetical protein
MPNKSASEYALLIAEIFQGVDQSIDNHQIAQAMQELRDIFDQVKGQSKYASLVPVINEAMIELNSALVFNEIANLQDNAKRLKPLIGTLQGITDEAQATTRALRLERLQLFLTAANEAAAAMKEAKDALDGGDVASTGPKLQTAWEKTNSLLDQLTTEVEELEQ